MAKGMSSPGLRCHHRQANRQYPRAPPTKSLASNSATAGGRKSQEARGWGL